MKINPIILIGGIGSRLWPLSRETYPKQFNCLIGEYSLFQQTVLRVRDLSNVNQIVVVVGQINYFLCLEQLEAMGAADVKIIVEPEGRNTAPAIAIAALAMSPSSEEEMMLVLPSDHHVQNLQKFQSSIQNAAANLSDKIVLFGMKPTYPAAGYGYIESETETLPANIKAFHEKPNEAIAKQYIQDNRYWWNCGIFFASVKTMIQAFQMHSPDVLLKAQASLAASVLRDQTIYLPLSQFSQMPNISFDYAIMEKTQFGIVVELESEWSDLGDWNAIYDALQKDENNNVIKGNVALISTQNAYLHSSDQLLACIGLNNVIVVATKDAVLVADKNKSQNVKQLVDLLKTTDREAMAKNHAKIFKAWGSCETLIKTAGYHLRHVILKPGKKLSLQSHQQRSEHWVILSGVADIICGEKASQLTANQSVYIPKHTKHRIANLQQEPLHFVEVQVGMTISEDDIVRYDDHASVVCA